ncbi:ABC transporter permease [Radicibacter daui]|uniref:ABC transporter permease n=1 Tax=Radicibacter daui TaxID=3064829 RepID=UPI004046A427
MKAGAATGRISGTGPLFWAVTGLLLLLVAFPLAFIILQAIFPEIGHASLARPFSGMVAALGDWKLLGMARNTVALGIMVMAGAALLAIPLGVFRVLFRLPLGRFWDLCFLVPFMIPPYIATLGWIMTLQPRGYLQQLTGINGAGFLFSIPGVAFVMVLSTFPVVYFAVSRTLEAVGQRYGDVARVFGASPLRAFWRITLPLATPGLAASLLLVFAMAIEEYGTPAALGRRAGFDVLVTGVDNRISDWPIDLSGAAVLSLLLVGLSLIAFFTQLRILSRRNYETTGGKPQAIERRPLGLWTVPVLLFFAFAAFIACAVPLLAILATALQRTLSGGLAFGNFGLQNFTEIWSQGSDGLTALMSSLSLGVSTALITGLLGALASYFVVRGTGRGRVLLDALSVLPNALPGVVVAVGLILAWNQPWLPVSPYNTPFILLIAYCCILLPFPVRYANAAFRQIGTSLESAARVAGAGPVVTLRRILGPLVAPSMVSAMLLVFAVASRELVASILVAPVGMTTVATFIWRQFEQGSVGLGMAMAFTAILITTALPLIVLIAMRRTRMVL